MIVLVKQKPPILKVWIFLAGVILGGCEAPQTTAMIMPMPDRPYELKHETGTLTLSFASHRARLAPQEKARLLAAIKPLNPGRNRGKSSTHVTLPRHISGLGKQRLKHLIRILLEAGVKPRQIHRSEIPACSKGNTLVIVLDTYQAIPPLCPNWSTAYGSGYGRGSTSNFGCATASNFLLMIDDPIVLFKGEKVLARDVNRDSLAVADYQAGKDKGKWLKVEKAEGGSSGSSGGGGS